MEWLSTAVEALFNLVGSTLTQITSNAVLSMFFVSGLVSIAVGVVRKLKRV